MCRSTSRREGFRPNLIRRLGLAKSFIDLNNQVLGRFSTRERSRIGVHTCPGGDEDSMHSANVDYSGLLPLSFELKAGGYYV